ncbi:hypothetical protein C0995_013877 [Termitomyces sp. Mi166|nr:hypothetical protein C0995_013877 [Termitomyces sp. Mi166\
MSTVFDPQTFVALPGVAAKGGELVRAELFWCKPKNVAILSGHVISLTGGLRGSTVPRTGIIAKMEQGMLLDATRADGTLVMLKAIHRINSPDEISVGKLLSSEPLVSPRNHCIPYPEVIDPPEGSDEAFIVLPLLVPFETVGEAVEFFRQIFEGLEFMHEHNVAHEYGFQKFT